MFPKFQLLFLPHYFPISVVLINKTMNDSIFSPAPSESLHRVHRPRTRRAPTGKTPSALSQLPAQSVLFQLTPFSLSFVQVEEGPVRCDFSLS
jgi:hypothetical protein